MEGRLVVREEVTVTGDRLMEMVMSADVIRDVDRYRSMLNNDVVDIDNWVG